MARWRWEEQTVTSLSELRALCSRTDLLSVVMRLDVSLDVTLAEEAEVQRLLTELAGTDAARGKVGVLQVELQLALRTDDRSWVTGMPESLQRVAERIEELRAHSADPAAVGAAGADGDGAAGVAADLAPELYDRVLTHLYRLLRERGALDSMGGPVEPGRSRQRPRRRRNPVRLVRLRVANFGCVRSADIHFGERLNVLYGRNDLGKSSLVSAIRAALFLQHDSSVHRPYVTWQAGEHPHVELTLQTEPQRYYRIKKTFGSKGRSLLEESKDGTIFLNPRKGRQVDGIIRSQLLPWGIPEPGGKRRERSMPSSFLSAALLAEQTDVTALFDRQLAGDGDESGKQLLADALQATAREPLFSDVLQAAQTKVDEAFTATGRRKRGRASPFHKVAQDITSTKAALDETRLESESGERIRAQLGDLEGRLLAKHGEAEEAERALATATAAFEKRAKQRAARAELDRVQAILDQAQAAQDAQAQAFARAETLRGARADSDDELRAAQGGLERARARVVEVKSAAGGLQAQVQALDLECADLQRRLGEVREPATRRRAGPTRRADVRRPGGQDRPTGRRRSGHDDPDSRPRAAGPERGRPARAQRCGLAPALARCRRKTGGKLRRRGRARGLDD